jgi:hypothetical protein
MAGASAPSRLQHLTKGKARDVSGLLVGLFEPFNDEQMAIFLPALRRTKEKDQVFLANWAFGKILLRLFVEFSNGHAGALLDRLGTLVLLFALQNGENADADDNAICGSRIRGAGRGGRGCGRVRYNRVMGTHGRALQVLPFAPPHAKTPPLRRPAAKRL